MSKCNDVCFVAKKMLDDPAYVKLLHDLDTMAIMQLRKKYAGEANTHRNMMSRVKSVGAKVHDDLVRFTDFLRHVGPKPTKKATLDRADNDDPEYAPGKVRWADKQTQNQNKGDSLIFTCLSAGRSYTASQLASKQGVTAAAIRNRRRQGWNDEEIIVGRRKNQKPITAKTSSAKYRRQSTEHMTAAAILFARDRAKCEHERRTDGVEPFIATPAELQDLVAEDFPQFRGEEWLQQAEKCFLRGRLPKYWTQYKHHINFNALNPVQQAWVLRIDPDQRQHLELGDAL